MSEAPVVRYEVDERVARITLDRPERGNGITRRLVEQPVARVERADLDPRVHVLALAGNGPGFCGGYDLVESAEGQGAECAEAQGSPVGSPLDPAVIAANHGPGGTPVGSPLDPAVIVANHGPGSTRDPGAQRGGLP